MTPYEWRQEFLATFSLRYADGRPLYQYRVSQEQFNSLSDLLKLSSIIGNREVLSIKDWDACFVIFASEWWRRKYSGNWGWDEIFSCIGLDKESIPTYERNELIRSGLRKWKREVRKRPDGSRQFLGTIATEGGLPMHQLASPDSRGWLRRVLRKTLIKHIKKRIPVNVLLSNVEGSIPKSFQSGEAISILTDIVTTTLNLRDKHKLVDKDSAATSWLDEHDPKWMEQFPLPLENDVATALLNDLINTASKESNPENYLFISSEYKLTQTDTSSPELLLEVTVSPFLEIEKIKNLINTSELPPVCNIKVESSESGLLLHLQGVKTALKNEEAYRFFGNNIITKKGRRATGVITWKLIFSGRVIFSEVVTESLLLDIISPWTFMEVDETWVLANTATCNISNHKAMVYIPSKLKYKTLGSDSELSLYGDFIDGRLYKLTGTIECKGHNEAFKITANSSENTHNLFLSGDLLSKNTLFQHSNPILIYRGLPELYEEDIITGCQSKKHYKCVAELVGQNPIKNSNLHNLEGVYNIAFLDNNKNTVLKKRLGLLDSAFDLKLQPISSDSGTITLTGINKFEVLIPNTKVISFCERISSGYKLTLDSKGEIPPQNIELVLYARHSKDLTLTVPFPASGAYLFAPDGCRIPMKTPLYLGDLMGYRLRVIEQQNTPIGFAELEFQLHDSELGYQYNKELYIREKLQINGQVMEFSIYDWIHHIDSLLKISSNPDATVTISYYRHGQDYFNVSVRRFASTIEPLFEQGKLSLSEGARHRYTAEDIAGIEIKTLYLQQPAQKYPSLEQATSEQVALGMWSVDPTTRAHGSWIFYPSKNSAINFRPVLWNIGDYSPDVQSATSLEKATAIRNPDQRISAIFDILKEMSLDKEHKSWQYISNLWDKTSNLPLSTFDIWKASVNQPEFIVALFIQGQTEILERIEQELPLLWELIPYKIWLDALSQLKEEYESLAILNASDLSQLLANKIRSIGKLSSSMQGIEQLLLQDLLNQSSPELQNIDRILTPTMEDYRINLLRQPERTRWPELLKTELSECFNSSTFSSIPSLEPPNNFQKSVMYLPAVLVERMLVSNNFMSQKLTSVDIFKIKQIKQFSPSWFDNTFQVLSAWLYKRLHEKGNQH